MINGFRGTGGTRSKMMYPGISFSGSWVWPQFHLSLRYTSVSPANKLPWEGSHSNWLSPGRCVLCHPEGNFRGPLPARICCSFEIGRGQFSEIIFLSLSRVGQANWAPVTFFLFPLSLQTFKVSIPGNLCEQSRSAEMLAWSASPGKGNAVTKYNLSHIVKRTWECRVRKTLSPGNLLKSLGTGWPNQERLSILSTSCCHPRSCPSLGEGEWALERTAPQN